MPTGYTADIEKGISFKLFALNCARNFGALISLRDSNMKYVPDEIKPGGYHLTEKTRAEKRLSMLKKMTEDSATKEAEKAHAHEMEHNEKYDTEKVSLKAKYEKMLAEVGAWTPPTPDHVNMKSFMERQIVESIEFDCHSYSRPKVKKLTGREWLLQEMEAAIKDIKYHEKEYAEEKERCDKSTAWIRQLKNSLKEAL